MKEGEGGKRAPHAGDLRKGRSLEYGATFLVTKTLVRPAEFSERQRDEAVEAILSGRAEDRYWLHAFVVMPDHFHLFLTQRDHELDKVMNWLLRRISFPARKRGEEISWLQGYHDHRLREHETVSGMISYVERNPVEANIRQDPTQYRWSSAHLDHQQKNDREILALDRWST